MSKQKLRSQYKSLREQLPGSVRKDLERIILKKIANLPIWDRFFFHLYLPIESKKEIDTFPLLSLLWEREKEVIIPRVRDGEELQHHRVDRDSKFSRNKWGIPEPTNNDLVAESTLDVIFVPMLAFDTEGHRLGYGKGYYDRFLAKCRPDVVKVGLSLFPPEEKLPEINDFDVRLDYAVTPKQVYSF